METKCVNGICRHISDVAARTIAARMVVIYTLLWLFHINTMINNERYSELRAS